MKTDQIWKNFKLGEEINIAGTFIYNGMRRFHEIKILDHEEDVFEVLYNLSVGLERLLKTAVVLLEHNENTDQKELEASLITHNHLELVKRIKNHVEIKLSSPHNDLLTLLSKFYKSLRYDRFMLSSAFNSKKEMIELCKFFEKHLNVEIKTDDPLFGTRNELQYRKFLRKTVLKISSTIYEVINDRSHDIGLYTYELRSGSRAESVFLGKIDIADEDVLWKELLIFLMNTNKRSGYLDFLRDIEPLEFDPALIGEYLDCFQSDAAKANVMDELHHLYSELEDFKDRKKMIDVVAAPGVDFYYDEEKESDEEEF